MKYLITLLLVLGIRTNLFSQDLEPTQRTFTIGGVSGQYLNDTNSYFKINNFLLGWHWGDQYKISKSLQMNQKDLASGDDYDSLSANTNLFIRSKYNGKDFSTHTHFDKAAIFGKSLKYDPTLYIDSNDVYKLHKRVGDPSNPVFGFLNKRGRILNNPSDVDYSRIIIDSIGLKDSVILSDPWPNDVMYYIPDHNGDDKEEIQINFSGRSFYVTINLKRYDTTVSILPETQILKIKVPYTIWTSKTTEVTKYAYFYRIPSIVTDDYDLMPQNNGKVWNLGVEIDTAVNRPQEMIIRAKMLPTDGSSMTISGYIDFDGIVPNTNSNHQLKRARAAKDGENYNKDLEANAQKIDKLKIEVTYLDTLPIAIDWVKFETPNARKINSGFYDDDIAASVQNDLDYFTGNADYVSRNIKPSRWIVNIEGNPVNWEAERHFRKIVGNVTTGATGGHLSTQWDEYLGTVDKWMEVNDITSYVASPFCASSFTNKTETSITHNSVTKTNSNYWKTFGIHQGYTKNDYPSGGALDRFNSGYEIFMKSPATTVEYVRNLPIEEYVSNSDYVRYTGSKCSFQTFWEWNLYKNYLDPYISGFAYSDKPWFAQTFIQEHLEFEDNWAVVDDTLKNVQSVKTVKARRFQTGEETNLFIWNSLIMGAKGLMYDGGRDSYYRPPNLNNSRLGQTKLLPTEKITTSEMLEGNIITLTDSSRFNLPLAGTGGIYDMDDYEFLNSPHLTHDFFDDSYNHIYFKIKPTFLQMLAPVESMLDTIAKYMGTVQQDGRPIRGRIFVGRRSVRNKLFETHNWVRANEEELMKLKLQAWYGKGYKIWENHHPDVSPTYFSDFIDKNNIRTRKNLCSRFS